MIRWCVVRRPLAILLVAQPMFWTANVVYAQSLEQITGRNAQITGRNAPDGEGREGPVTPPDTMPLTRDEVLRLDRSEALRLDRSEALRPDRSEGAALTAPGRPVPIDEPVDASRYVLGPGDVLDLNFWGVQSFNLRVTVDVEGRIFVPKVGYFTVMGTTLADTRRSLTASVAKYYRLNFGVTLAEPRTFLVQVVGAVIRPGAYPVRATDRIAAVIAKAGGLDFNGSRRAIEIQRRDGSKLAADLVRYELTGNIEQNPYLRDADIVRVPYQSLVVTVFGAVNRPGTYELIGAKDSTELLDLAGGLAPNATTVLPVRVVRKGAGERDEQLEWPFSRDGSLASIPLKKEDALTFPASKELQRMIVVTGAIAGATAGRQPAGTSGRGAVTPGATLSLTPDEATATRYLSFADGETVRTVLERAGGVGPLADLKGSYILRRGAVVPIDLYSLTVLKDFVADRPVELGDTVVIPFRRTNIFVEGAVFAPGSYPFNPTFGLEQYLSLAGGLNRFAQPLDSVRLVTSRGEMKEYRPDLVVEPGSSIVVPERNFSRSEVVQLVLSAASVLLAGVAVVIAAKK